MYDTDRKCCYVCQALLFVKSMKPVSLKYTHLNLCVSAKVMFCFHKTLDKYGPVIGLHNRIPSLHSTTFLTFQILTWGLPPPVVLNKVFKFAKNLSWGKFVFKVNPKTTTKVIFQKVAILSGKNHKPTIIILNTENTNIPPTEIPEALARYFYDTSATHNFPSHFVTINSSPSRPLPPPSDQYYNSLFSLNELDWPHNKCRGMSSGPDNIGYPMLQNMSYQS